MGVLQQNRKNAILLGQDNNALIWLIVINAVVFLMISFLKVSYFMHYETNIEASQNFRMQILNWVTLSGKFPQLEVKPWTILTYMFTHQDIWHMVGTIFWLWGFGYILQDLAGNSKLVPLYLYGGLAGSLTFIAATNFLPKEAVEETLLGGVPSIMALAVAVTFIAPRYRLFPMINGGIPIWVLTAIFILIDLATTGNVRIILAHLSGGVVGLLFAWQLQKGTDLGLWMHRFSGWLSNLFNPEKKYATPTSKQNFYHVTRKPYEKIPHITQQRVDELLDKINQTGYHSLTSEEKEFLKNASRQDINL